MQHLRTRVKTNGEMVVEVTTAEHAGEFVIDGTIVTGSFPRGTESQDGFITSAQVQTLLSASNQLASGSIILDSTQITRISFPGESVSIQDGVATIGSSDPFELSYLLKVSAETQIGNDGDGLSTIASLVGPVPEIVIGTPTLGLTSFAGSKGIYLPFSPRATFRQAIPTIFSPEKPFTLLTYMSLGNSGSTAKYIFGFGNAGGSTRCILLNSGADFLNLQWSIVSTATDLPPVTQIQRIGGNVYQGRRCKNNERALFGLIYDGTNWYSVFNGSRMALAAGYGYTTRTAGTIEHDGYLYINGGAYSGLNTYISNPILREYALVDHAVTDNELSSYWRYVAAQTEISVYCVGDSITWGSNASVDGTLGTLNGYPQQLQTLQSSRVVTNWGKVADKTTQILARINSGLKYFIPRNRGVNCVAVILAGTNDLLSTTDSATVIYTRILQIVTTLRSHGCGTIIGCTVLPSTSITGARETERLALNVLLTTNNGNNFTAISNIAIRSNLTDASNLTYYADGTHPTDAGYVEIATGIDATLDGLSL